MAQIDPTPTDCSETSAANTNPTIIDLRSDTVTLPTDEMYAAMTSMAVADDSLDGDPTAQELERVAARLLGKEAGLFLPTCTMANLVAILAQSPRSSRILAGATSHIASSERGGMSLTGCALELVADDDGVLDAAELEQRLASSRSHLQAGVITMETTHNESGGRVPNIPQMQILRRIANAVNVPIHLDGARLFNAALCLGTAPGDIAEVADTVAICLSKGLSAPAGAVLVGSRQRIAQARTIRRSLGGQQRQIGVLAAAGLVGLHSMVARLADDHDLTKKLALGLQQLSPDLTVNKPQTNIIQVDVSQTGYSSHEWVKLLRIRGVLVRLLGPSRLRLVVHRHISEDMAERTVLAFADALGPLVQADLKRSYL